MKRHFSEVYRLFCEGIEADASTKLARSLTHEERLGIWNAGSLMLLEVVEREIRAATTGAAVSHMLVEGAVTFQARRTMDLDVGVERLHKALGRPLTLTERDQFHNVATLYEAMHIVEYVLEAEPAQREPLLQSLLAGDVR
jgi:hypothetical protein